MKDLTSYDPVWVAIEAKSSAFHLFIFDLGQQSLLDLCKEMYELVLVWQVYQKLLFLWKPKRNPFRWTFPKSFLVSPALRYCCLIGFAFGSFKSAQKQDLHHEEDQLKSCLVWTHIGSMQSSPWHLSWAKFIFGVNRYPNSSCSLVTPDSRKQRISIFSLNWFETIIVLSRICSCTFSGLKPVRTSY